jgi:hypothetical protein
VEKSATGAADARDQTTNAVGRRLHGWQVGAEAGGRSPQYVAAIRWGTKRYLQMNRLAEVVAVA